MKLWYCHCKYGWVIGKKKVYGPIVKMDIGDYPNALMSIQDLITKEEWEDNYGDCVNQYEHDKSKWISSKS